MGHSMSVSQPLGNRVEPPAPHFRLIGVGGRQPIHESLVESKLSLFSYLAQSGGTIASERERSVIRVLNLAREYSAV